MAAAWLSKHVGYLKFLYRLEIRVIYIIYILNFNESRLLVSFASLAEL